MKHLHTSAFDKKKPLLKRENQRSQFSEMNLAGKLSPDLFLRTRNHTFWFFMALCLASIWIQEGEASTRQTVLRKASASSFYKARNAAYHKVFRSVKYSCGKEGVRLFRPFYKCHRSKKNHRCKVKADFLCKRKQSKKKKEVHFTKGAHCKKKFIRKAASTSKTRRKAKKKARKLVYRKAKQQCGIRKVAYVGSWRYQCQRVSKIYRCTAQNMLKCCERQAEKHIAYKNQKRNHSS